MKKNIIIPIIVALLFFTSFSNVNAQFKLYGMCADGGLGQIFDIDTAGNFKDLYDFKSSPDGSEPHGSFVLASDGNLYGMTEYGGVSDSGTIIEYNLSTDTYSKIYDLTNASGAYPEGSLMQASNGKLYGMARGGGKSGVGTIFSYDITTKVFTKLYDFNTTNGASPYGSLMQATNGNLYGMTATGGSGFWGVIFSFNPTTDVFTALYNLGNLSTDGQDPYGSLIQATDGKLYGLTSNGGTNFAGVIFSFDLTSNIYTTMYSFLTNTNDGISPYGDLFQAINGKLYGLTFDGGNSSNGTIFSYNISTSTYAKVYDFGGGLGGQSPYGSFVLGPDGKLFATTYQGGLNSDGSSISFDPTNNAVVEIYASTSVNAWEPYGNFVMVPTPTSINELSASLKTICIEPNPNNGNFIVKLKNITAPQQLLIYNVMGQKIYETTINSEETQINLSNKQEGVYLYQVLSENGKNLFEGKVVIQE